MSAMEVIQMFLGGKLPIALPKIKLDNWTVSEDGVRCGPVTKAKTGIKNVDIFWAHLEFMVDGRSHVLDVERGLKGGVSTIVFDGTNIVGGHIAFKKHIAGFPPKFKLEIDIKLPTTTF